MNTSDFVLNLIIFRPDLKKKNGSARANQGGEGGRLGFIFRVLDPFISALGEN